MNKLKTFPLPRLYEMGSGLSSNKDQAGHGSPFVSFSVVFNNYFLPDELEDLMETTKAEQDIHSVREGDVLLTRTSETIDELAMSAVALKDYPDATFSGFLKRLRPISNETYAKYMAFYFRSPYFRRVITNNAFMTLRASFNEEIFKFLEASLPSYEQQRLIGDLLYGIERCAYIKRQIINATAKLIDSIYSRWFCEFEFESRETAGTYKSSGGTFEWSKELNRNIPIGWTVAPITKLSFVEVVNPGVDAFVERRYLATSDIKLLDISRGSIVKYETRESRANMQSEACTVWFAKMKNSVKHLYVSSNMDAFVDNLVLSTGFCGIKCDAVGFEYVASVVNNPWFERKKDSLAHGATQEAVNYDDLLLLKIPVPPKEILELYHERTEPLFRIIGESIIELERLNDLKEFLVPLFVNGQASIIE